MDACATPRCDGPRPAAGAARAGGGARGHAHAGLHAPAARAARLGRALDARRISGRWSATGAGSARRARRRRSFHSAPARSPAPPLPCRASSSASALGFERLSPNSIDAVGDRDFVADLLFALTMLGTHLSRLAEDLILFGSSEFGFVRFSDAFTTGSSMMPQKRNPDALELARGSAARGCWATSSRSSATIKGLPSGYNKDLQEDKRTLFDAVDAITLAPAGGGRLGGDAHRERRSARARRVSSSMMATDLADYLVRKRVTFRDAHGAVGRLVREAEDEGGRDGSTCPLASFPAANSAFAADVLAELAPETSVSHREIIGGTGPRGGSGAVGAAQRLFRVALPRIRYRLA